MKLSDVAVEMRIYAVIDDEGAPDHGCQTYGTVVDFHSGPCSGIPAAKVLWDDTNETHWINLDRIEEVPSDRCDTCALSGSECNNPRCIGGFIERFPKLTDEYWELCLANAEREVRP